MFGCLAHFHSVVWRDVRNDWLELNLTRHCSGRKWQQAESKTERQ